VVALEPIIGSGSTAGQRLRMRGSPLPAHRRPARLAGPRPRRQANAANKVVLSTRAGAASANEFRLTGAGLTSANLTGSVLAASALRASRPLPRVAATVCFDHRAGAQSRGQELVFMPLMYGPRVIAGRAIDSAALPRERARSMPRQPLLDVTSSV
jgi:hypothetical protein